MSEKKRRRVVASAPTAVQVPAPAPAPALAPRLRIEYVHPDSIKLWDKNPRRNDEATARVAELIKVHGFNNPIGVRGGVAFVGNTRLKAARLLGLTEIPIVRLDHLTETQAVAHAIADNRSSQFAEWDEGELAARLAELDAAGLPEESVSRMTGLEVAEIEGIRVGYKLQENDPAKEWEGMPEYEHEDQTSFRRVVVHFKCQEDIDRFSELVEQNFTDRTRSIWFPKAEIGTIADSTG